MSYTITIINGTGDDQILNGDYTVTASAVGYDNNSIQPNTITVIEGTDTYGFTIGATGTLTLHVTEDGLETGIPVVGATFRRTDAGGVELYGMVITSDEFGDAVFPNVPFADTGAPTVYYLQIDSDGEHEHDSSLQSTSLLTENVTLQVENKPAADRTINLTDANYTGLPIVAATVMLS